jgi:hypothetical protein
MLMTALRRNTTGRRAALAAAPIALAGLLTAAVPTVAPAAAAAPCVSMTGPPISSPSTGGSLLSDVTVRSLCDAWAVGALITPDGGHGQSLAMHWDGARWTRTPSESPDDQQNWLRGVAATSATSAWAVGFTGGGSFGDQILIEHWDGRTWTVHPTPSPGTEDRLFAVAATSATRAWAVGSFRSADGIERTLIERLDGTSWTKSDSPSPSPNSASLFGVLGIGWAVGETFPGPQPLIERWDGRNWSVAPGAGLDPGTTGGLAGMSATSPSDIWAVGDVRTGNGQFQNLIEHYDGSHWTKVTNLGPGQLLGVTATRADDVWAVGSGPSGAEIFHYDGTSWAPVPVASTRTSTSTSILQRVSGSSPANVWAVGYRSASPKHFDPVAVRMRCC